MALWGEGDPRWIVEERSDAKNVNNWHWAEKDASQWSKDKLRRLLVGKVFDGPEGTCRVSEASYITGEASANNRKAKLIFFYEWEIVLRWTGVAAGGSPEVSGELVLPNLSEENEVEEVEVRVTTDKQDKHSQQLKELMLREAPPPIRGCLREYVRCLKEEYSAGLILQRSPEPPSSSSSSSKLPLAAADQLVGPTSAVSLQPKTSKPASRKSTDLGCPIHTTKLTLIEEFLASVEDIYNCFTTTELVQQFTRSEAKVDARKGGTFSMLNSEITGEFVEVDSNKIVQKWRRKGWPEGHHSTVTISLTQESHGTKLRLLQTDVPEDDAERTREGWKRYIFNNIKTTFGYGTLSLAF